MKINTLGDFAKHIPRRVFTDASTPIDARTALYSSMAHYMDCALCQAKEGTTDTLNSYMRAAGALLASLLVDARNHLDETKYQYLLTNSIVEPGGAPEARGGDLMDAIKLQWGSEDMFMFRLSGGLPGSYVKALAGLKNQLRYAGTTLPRAVEHYVRSL